MTLNCTKHGLVQMQNNANHFYHHINFCIEDILSFLTVTFTEWLILFIQY